MGNSLFRIRGNGMFRVTGGSGRVEMGRWLGPATPVILYPRRFFPYLYITKTAWYRDLKRKKLNSILLAEGRCQFTHRSQTFSRLRAGMERTQRLLRPNGILERIRAQVFYAKITWIVSDVSAAVGLGFPGRWARAFALADFRP